MKAASSAPSAQALLFGVGYLNLAPISDGRQKNSSGHGRCADWLSGGFVVGALENSTE